MYQLVNKMKLKLFIFACIYCLNTFIFAQLPNVISGRIERHENFKSQYVQARNIDVWLPHNYNAQKKYAVLYMHDGQMLFDSTITWNKQEWQVDENITKLAQKNLVKECIIVGIWNVGDLRRSEYFPKKAFDFLSDTLQKMMLEKYLDKKVKSDDYLLFLTKEVKPFIDTKYSTLKDRKNTLIAGSSMGGLISMYAICEYPDIFGGAACLSTHWIGSFEDNDLFPPIYLKYLEKYLPSPKKTKIYFDCGNQTLDKFYPRHQKKVDELMIKKGFKAPNFMTKTFEGESHSEKSWSKRLDIPMLFLLKK